MLTPVGFRQRQKYYRPHPLQGTFALIACMALAGLIAIFVLFAMSR